MKTRSNIDFASAARATNLLDPAAPQDAATRAYVDTALGWKDLALVSPVAVNAAEFAPIDQSYGELRLLIEGISHDGAANQQLTLAVSADGSAFSAGQGISGMFAGSSTIFGAIAVPGYRLDTGAMPGATVIHTSSPAIAQGSAWNPVWRCTGGIMGLRIAITGGALFDAGKLRLQARH
jgi:hypothetical protein